MSKMARTYLQPSAPISTLYTPDPSQSAVFIIRWCNLCRCCKLLQATSSRHLVHPLVPYVTSDVHCCLCQQNSKTTSAIFCLEQANKRMSCTKRQCGTGHGVITATESGEYA